MPGPGRLPVDRGEARVTAQPGVAEMLVPRAVAAAEVGVFAALGQLVERHHAADQPRAVDAERLSQVVEVRGPHQFARLDGGLG